MLVSTHKLVKHVCESNNGSSFTVNSLSWEVTKTIGALWFSDVYYFDISTNVYEYTYRYSQAKFNGLSVESGARVSVFAWRQ